MRRLLLAAFAACVAAVPAPRSAGATGAPPDGASSSTPRTALALAPCWLDGIEHEARCGSLTRPLDPARPGGTSIDIRVAVLPALARNKRTDPVFFFAGGPGQSAIAIAATVRGLLARLGHRRDIVLIDQRGTGSSAPLRCDEPPQLGPLSEALDAAAGEARLASCLKRLRTLPWGDLRFFTTTVAMQDADAVREALGAERVNLVGGSYGTRAALEYQRQFPQRVRRLVIDGVVPPDMVLPAAFSPDNEAALQALLDACAHESACARRYPALAADLQRLLQSLPRRAAVAHPITGLVEDVLIDRDTVMSALRQPLYAPPLASALPAAIEQAAGGRFEGLLGLGLSLGQPRKGSSLAQGMHFAVVCAEDMPLLAAGKGDAVGATFRDSYARTYERICRLLSPADVPPAFYAVPPAPAPALVLSGGIDPATPPRHGERVARALGPKARHVVVAEAGHGVMALPCVRDALFRFIDAVDEAEAMHVDAGCAARIPRPLAFQWPPPGERP